jgi:hypothetical protein|tara:strand:+ start:924 stop:1541 length:618 start_codon:yes stop_codon:yes gene_type:complete
MKIKTSKLNRETYLQEATTILRKSLFSPKGFKVPKVKLSVSWASRGNKTNKNKLGVSVLGQCYPTQLSDDGINHVIITPALSGSTLEGSLRILGVLVHELVHAVDNCESGHGQAFKQCATAVGLTGQMRSTGESEWLQNLMTEKIVKKLGLFPHQQLRTGGRTQTTRNIKVSCNCCDFSFRTSRKNLNMINEFDCPTGCGGELDW